MRAWFTILIISVDYCVLMWPHAGCLVRVWEHWLVISVTRVGAFLTLGSFLKPLETINLSKSLTFLRNFVNVSKSFIFLVKSFLGNFYRHLAIFVWSHCWWSSYWWNRSSVGKEEIPCGTKVKLITCSNQIYPSIGFSLSLNTPSNKIFGIFSKYFLITITLVRASTTLYKTLSNLSRLYAFETCSNEHNFDKLFWLWVCVMVSPRCQHKWSVFAEFNFNLQCRCLANWNVKL